MRPVTVRPEQARIQAIIQTALRAAATAPTIYDALDVTGSALRSIQDLAQRFDHSATIPENNIAY